MYAPVFTLNGVTVTRFLSALMHHCFRILHTILEMIVGLCDIVMLIVLSISTGHKNFLLRPAHRSHEFGKRISGRQTLCTWYHGDQNKQRTQCLRNSSIFFSLCLQLISKIFFIDFFSVSIWIFFFCQFSTQQFFSQIILLKISHSYGITTLLHCVQHLRDACILAGRSDFSTIIILIVSMWNEFKFKFYSSIAFIRNYFFPWIINSKILFIDSKSVVRLFLLHFRSMYL